MSKMYDLFSDEEKRQLSYLGSMLRQEPTEEEAEMQRILDWFIEHGAKGKGAGPQAQNKQTRAEEGRRLIQDDWCLSWRRRHVVRRYYRVDSDGYPVLRRAVRESPPPGSQSPLRAAVAWMRSRKFTPARLNKT